MADTSLILNFLKKLKKNNAREWVAENQAAYKEARKIREENGEHVGGGRSRSRSRSRERMYRQERRPDMRHGGDRERRDRRDDRGRPGDRDGGRGHYYEKQVPRHDAYRSSGGYRGEQDDYRR